MARIAGVDIPNQKRVEVSLTYLYGVGKAVARDVLKKSNIDPTIRVKDLSDQDLSSLRGVMEREYVIEGDLRREVTYSIKRLMDIGSYRGLRHRRSLPVRGQRTKTNSRTRKGPCKTVGARKKD